MGQQFEDIYGYTHNATTEISRGGQGIVFRTENPNIAVKVALNSLGNGFSEDSSDNEAFESLRLLPIPSKINLTLPQATLRKYSGYVMTLLDDMESFESSFDYSFQTKCGYINEWLESLGNEELTEVFGQYIISGGLRRRLNAYLHIAKMLSQLHSNGLVYCDFSTKNAFISKSKENDNVWLIDADNLNYQEETKASGYYTPGFGAPEVIKGKGCTFYSDSYAFAVSLYWQITGTHPFKEALLESNFDDDDDFADDHEDKAYSGEYPWINDAEDDSNHTTTCIPHELIISSRLNELFQKEFSEEGRTKRHTRPTMFEWVHQLSFELDHTIRCKKCQMDYDHSFDVCPWCDNNNDLIVLESSENNNQIWSYSHEIGDKSFVVPMRIINGFRNKQIDDIAFRIEKKHDKIVISELNECGEWFISLDKISFTPIYGEVALPHKCYLKNASELKEVVIEVKTKWN